MKPTKLRLLIAEDCNRNCAGCCNKQYDLKALPIETDFSQYSTIMLTGGEPMLDTPIVFHIIHRIRAQNPNAKIIMYTAKVNDWQSAIGALQFLDGITVTLHEQSDTIPFHLFSYMIPNSFKNTKSFRLNIFKGITVGGISSSWQVKDNIEWIDNCPLPEGEVFKRL